MKVNYQGVNALNGLTSFLHDERLSSKSPPTCVNALNGLTSFLPIWSGVKGCGQSRCVNALNGLTSFLRYPLKPLENTGFPASFLQVFVRLF